MDDTIFFFHSPSPSLFLVDIFGLFSIQPAIPCKFIPICAAFRSHFVYTYHSIAHCPDRWYWCVYFVCIPRFFAYKMNMIFHLLLFFLLYLIPLSYSPFLSLSFYRISLVRSPFSHINKEATKKKTICWTLYIFQTKKNACHTFSIIKSHDYAFKYIIINYSKTYFQHIRCMPVVCVRVFFSRSMLVRKIAKGADRAYNIEIQCRKFSHFHNSQKH